MLVRTQLIRIVSATSIILKRTNRLAGYVKARKRAIRTILVGSNDSKHIVHVLFLKRAALPSAICEVYVASDNKLISPKTDWIVFRNVVSQGIEELRGNSIGSRC